MRFIRLQNAVLAAGFIAIAGFLANTTAPVAYAQSNVTGGLSGVVADATGAVIPGAKVLVTDASTNAKYTLVTNAEGRYTVGLLKPGPYKVTASAASLSSDTLEVTVILGTTATGDIKLSPTSTNTIVEVSASALPLVDTQNVTLATTFDEQQIQQLPTPGGDVTTVAFTAPGIVVNAGGEYGNFSSDGLPGISNLFVLNGFDNQDPFLNLNNSGSSNLTLGQGELADATVIQNAYNSQYGRAAGAILEYTTKSGGNRFHGEALESYNGTVLNANGWFNESEGQARPHAVSNEWALNGGGPIIKDKLFFFSDYEGLHYVLPASGYVSLPSSEFEAYTLATIPASTASTYNQMFALYNGAASYKGATPVATVAGASPANPGGGCGGLSGATAPDGSILGQDTACALSAYGNANNINIEWLFTQRIDWNISDKHKIYGRYKMDHGSQPTYTSFVDPAFNTVSIQPEYEGQFNDSYTITPNLINSAVVAANWYTAYFGPADIGSAQTVLPFFAVFGIGADGSGTPESAGLSNLGVPDAFPQGRNVTQYQLEEDLSWTHGKHSFKFGANFRRDDFEDFDAQEETVFPELAVFSLNDIAQGTLCGANSQWCNYNVFQQAFITDQTAHLALYNLGVYAQDEWQVLPRLKLTLGARFDRTGPPLCHGGCFSLYTGSYPNSAASLTTAYSSEINPVNPHPFNVDPIEFQPRFGFNYQFDEKTVLRGGAGLFSDLYPAVFVDNVFENFPNDNTETLLASNIQNAGAGSMYANAAAGNSAVSGGFGTGGTVTSLNNSLTALGIPFSPPALGAYFAPSNFHEAQYVEYSLQLQRQFGKSDGLSITYAGNYGFREVMQNPYLNASSGVFSNATASWTSAGSIGGLSATPPDPSFANVNAFTNDAHSNYSAGMVTFTHQGHGLTGHLSYTYSHALDMVSNAGFGNSEPYNGGTLAKQLTPTLGPGNLNYSNADYDIRNDLVGDMVYEEPYKVANKLVNPLVSGWTVAAKEYYRSGEPFSVTNNNEIGGFQSMSGGNLMAQATVANPTNTCGSNPHAAVTTPCLDSTQYLSSQTTFGNLRRNAFYGPHYADTDATLSKQIVKTEGITFTLGAQAFNLFNHPNFSNPGGTGGDSNFGFISSTQAPPTSPYGSFQSAAVTQRVLVVNGKITF
jgi:outer membrane receptor protein involved in Fe transport